MNLFKQFNSSKSNKWVALYLYMSVEPYGLLNCTNVLDIYIVQRELMQHDIANNNPVMEFLMSTNVMCEQMRFSFLHVLPTFTQKSSYSVSFAIFIKMHTLLVWFNTRNYKLSKYRRENKKERQECVQAEQNETILKQSVDRRTA